MVSKRGQVVVHLVSIEASKRLNNGARFSLKSLLLSDTGRGELLVAERGAANRRTIKH